MIEASRRRRIMDLALPIIGGMVSQNILNLVDTAMVGQLGDAALAGVALGGFVNFMTIAFVTGMASGVQATAARRLGEGKTEAMAIPLNGGLLLAAIISVPASIAMFFLAPSVMASLAEDTQVASMGGAYLQCRVVAMVAVGMNFAFRGYWNATNRSRLYLRTLVVMHVCNVLISYVLIFGKLGLPALGVVGAGIGTAASTFIGLAYYCWLGLVHARDAGFLKGIPKGKAMRSMLRISLPSGAQQFLFAAGLTVFFTLIGKVGTQELAAASVITNLFLVGILPGIAFGLAATSLVGQALGAGDPAEAKRWGWDVAKVAAGRLALLSLPALVAPQLLLWPFIKNPETLALAIWPLRIVAASLVLEAVAMTLLNALLGAGASRTVMLASVASQWGVQLPLVFLLGPVMGYGLTAIYVVSTLSRVSLAAVFVVVWRRGKWAEIEV